MPTARAIGSVPGRRPSCSMAAELQRHQRGTRTQDQGADSHGALEFMCGDAHRGDAQRAEIDRLFANDLDGVGVHGHAGAVCQSGQFGHGLEHARIVVAEHYAEQAGVRREQWWELVDPHDAAGGDRQRIESPSLLQQSLSGSKHTGMFDRRDDDLPWRNIGSIPSQAEHGEVIGFGTTAGKENPVGGRPADGRPEVFSDRFPSFFEDFPGLLSSAVLAGRIGVGVAKAAGHRLDDFRPGRRRGVMIQVDQFHE